MGGDRITGDTNALNQRGGRMLSIVDILAAGTLDLRLAACLMRIIQGRSVA